MKLSARISERCSATSSVMARSNLDLHLNSIFQILCLDKFFIDDGKIESPTSAPQFLR